MRHVSFSALLTVVFFVGIQFAEPATAGSTGLNADTTIASDNTGDSGGAPADDTAGGTGGAAFFWDNINVDLIVEAGVTITGGAGGDGGADSANDGGSLGGQGGNGLHIWEDAGTVTASGIFIYGGAAGNGSDGGTAGANDTYGGAGGIGGSGVGVAADDVGITLVNATVVGGDGGLAGNAGDSPADANDWTEGGYGGDGGHAIGVFSGSGAIISLTNTTVIGGNGGGGGVSLPNGPNTGGGDGGVGIMDLGTNTTIVIGAGSVVAGGDRGAPGTGGTGTGTSHDGRGILFSGVGASLTNHGSILGSDTGSREALLVYADIALVDNHGTIGASSGHAGRAVYVLSGGIELFRNRASGLIQSTGSTDTIVFSSGTVTELINEGSIINSASGDAIYAYGGSLASFTNSGTIHAEGGSAIGINGDVADTFVNTGGTISSTSASAINIVWDLGANGIVFDGGQIIGGTNAIRVQAAQTGSIGVKNAAVDGNMTFLAPDETLNVWSSSLDGDVTFAGGTNNLNFMGGGAATTILADTQFSSAGFLYFTLLAGADVVSNAEQNEANSAISQLTTIASSHLTLNEDFWVDATVLNEGAIEIAAGKTLTANQLSGAGTYVFAVSDAATLGRINAQGTGSELDVTDASLEIKLSNPADMFTVGANLLLAEDLNGNAIVGAVNGSLLADNSALLAFLLYRGDAPEIGLDDGLLFAQVQLALLADIAGEGDDPNAIALGAALDEIGLDGDADIDDLMLALALLPTNEDINEVLDSLLPETDGVAYDIATDAGDQVLDVASRRLDGLRGTHVAAREYKLASTVPVRSGISPDAGRFWGQAFGRAVDQSRHAYNDGYDAGTYGFALGADASISGGKALLGAAFAYADTDADGNGINRTDTKVDTYQLVLYADRQFNDAVYAKALLAYGWHQNDIVRHDVGGIAGNNASGAYDATQFNARAELGRAFTAGTNLTLIPRFDLTYAAYDPDSYSEAGVGGLGLDVAGESLQSLRLGVGVLARWNVPLATDGLFQPELRLNYRRDLTRERFETTSALIGAPGLATFRTQGVEPPADILHLGVGALLATAGGIDLRASYDLELKQDYTAHGGYIRASLPF